MRTRGVIAGLVVLITALACCGSAGARTSKPRTQTASAPIAGGATVSATLTYTPHGYYDTGIALSITRAGRNVLSERVDAKPCRSYCAVGAGKAVHVVDLAGSGEPEVFVDLYTGGAHCCSITRFFTYDAASDRYRASQHDWGDPGYRLKTLGGQAVFETADDRFAYAFTDFAGSGLPLELLRFNGAKLVDVTTQFPALIARDAAVWLRAPTTPTPSGSSPPGRPMRTSWATRPRWPPTSGAKPAPGTSTQVCPEPARARSSSRASTPS